MSVYGVQLIMYRDSRGDRGLSISLDRLRTRRIGRVCAWSPASGVCTERHTGTNLAHANEFPDLESYKMSVTQPKTHFNE